MSAKRGVDILKTVAEYMSKSESFDRVTNMLKVTGGGEGKCIAEFTVQADHLNRMGTLHGGLSATILDNVTTYALISKDNSHPGVSVSLNINYLSGAKEGDVVEVVANTVRAGRNLAYLECELRLKANGKVLATGGQTKYINFNEFKME